MISERDKDFLEAIAFLTKTVATNDFDAVPALLEKINMLETLGELDIATLMEALEIEASCNEGDPDAYVLLVNGMDCVTSKEYRLRRHSLKIAIERMDLAQLRQYVDDALSAEKLADDVENDYQYFMMLIKSCTVLRDYAAMDLLRRKMVI